VNFPPLRLLLTALAIFALAAPFRLAAQTPAASAPPDPGVTLASYIKFAPPQALAQDIMGVARQISPGMQTEMLPLMILGRYGYPTFPGVSTTLPVTVFIFNGPGLAGRSGYVIAAQITADSPARAAFVGLHLQSQTDPASGLTFLSPNPTLLALALNQSADLAKIATEPANVDLQVTAPTSDLTFLRSTLQTTLQARAVPSGSKKWLDFSLQELQAVSQIQVSLDCKPDAIRIAYSLTAQPGTPLARLFSAPAGGPVPAAQFVSADQPIIAVAREDIPATQAYLNQVFADAQTIAGPNSKQLLAGVQAALNAYLAQADGTVAESFSLSGRNNLHAQVLAGGKVTDASVVNFLQQMYPGFMAGLMQRLNTANGNFLLTNVTLNLNAGNLSSAPVHEVVMQQTLNPSFTPTTPTQQTALLAFTQNGTRDSRANDMYFSAVNGYYASASSLAGLTAIAQAVQSGQPVPNNVASVLTLSPGEIMAGQADLGQLVAGYLAKSNPSPSGNDTQPAPSAPPITFSATTGANQIQFNITIPIAAIVQAVQLSRPPPPPPPPQPANPALAPASGNTAVPPSTVTPPQNPAPASPASSAAPSSSSN
jgi:hypothetical protein